VVALLLPIIGLVPMFNGLSIIDTADGELHMYRIAAMTALLQQGDLYPRWVPYFHLGYGYPIFNFYAPSGAWLGGVLGVLGVPAPLALPVLTALAWMLGSAGCFALARRWLPVPAALLAAAVWCYAPTRFQMVWNIGSPPAFLGAALAPWLILALIRAARSPGRRTAAGLALAWGLVLLTHQPTALLMGMFCAVAAPLACLWSPWGLAVVIQRARWTVIGLLLGTGLAAIFLLPMLLESRYTQLDTGAADIPAVLRASFIAPQQLFIQPGAPDHSDLSRHLPETVGLGVGLIALVGIGGLILQRQFGLTFIALVSGAMTLFLMSQVSLPVWLLTSLLGQLRFPGRVLAIGSLAFALMAGGCFWLLPARWRVAGSGVLIAVVIAIALPTLYPSRDWLDFSHLSPVDAIEYEYRTTVFGTTSFNEFKPSFGQEATAYDLPPDLESYAADPFRLRVRDVLGGTAQVESIAESSLRVTAGSPVDLRLRRFYWPGTRVSVDGIRVEPQIDLFFGLVRVPLSAGTHVVTVWQDASAVQIIAPFISFICLLATIALWRRGAAPLAPVEDLPPPGLAWGLSLALVGFACVNALFIQPHTTWFRLRSPLDQPAAMQTGVRQTFGDAYELLGYSLGQDSATAGGRLDVTLYWRALRSLDRFYRPVVQVVDPQVTEAWGVSQRFFIGRSPVLHTPGYFVADYHPIAIFDDRTPGTGRLLVWLEDATTGERLRLPDGRDSLLLDQPVVVR
jgi:hypothetical protein